METTQTFGVRIIALRKKSNSDEAFIYARITVSKKVIDMSLKRTTLCSLWDTKENTLTVKHLKQNKSISLLMKTPRINT